MINKEGENVRLDKLLANMGYGSRKEVKKLLKDGVVKIDGISVKDAKVHVNVEEQEVMIHGEVVEYKEFVYLMMHKPQGVISATEDDNHETVIDLLELEDAIFNPFPVGRLDIDTEGFLLITNDGSYHINCYLRKACAEKILCTRCRSSNRRGCKRVC